MANRIRFETNLDLIGINWPVGLVSGWGVLGLNLSLAIRRISSRWPVWMAPAGQLNDLAAIARPQVARLKDLSHQALAAVEPHVRAGCQFDFPVYSALGNHLQYNRPWCRGSPHVGVVFFEDTNLTREDLVRAREFDFLITGSTWNQSFLRERGLKNIGMIMQGIDPSHFHPAPKSGWFRDRFVVFSGGKFEYRKGQDLVVAAFRIFRRRHPEAFLLTQWHNHWYRPAAAMGPFVDGTPKIGAERTVLFRDWMDANGIKDSDWMDVGVVSNPLNPLHYREADVALFPNRCEGGTNLVAMEVMACGVPTILSANTGHLDLIDAEHCISLKQQGPPVLGSTDSEMGWGESNLDEIVESLEFVYSNREVAKRIGDAAAAFMRKLSWDQQASLHLSALDDRQGLSLTSF